MSEKVSLSGWAITWCQKLFPADPGQNPNPPILITDPNKTISIIYDEYIAYALYFKVLRSDTNLRPFVKAELQVSGIKDPIFFTNNFNQQHVDPREPQVEISFGPHDTVRDGKLYWPFNIKDFHKQGIHTLTISTGTKKYGESVDILPEWNPSMQIKIEIFDVIPKN
jgi:hypothetical protein